MILITEAERAEQRDERDKLRRVFLAAGAVAACYQGGVQRASVTVRISRPEGASRTL